MKATPAMKALTAAPTEALNGQARVPGDKSISHRALMFGALSLGETRVSGLLEGEDVLSTAAALKKLGAEIERGADGTWSIWGRGLGALKEPDDVLDLGNSGTSARLLSGILASHPIVSVITGDASLRKRPMGRVTVPLGQMGAQFISRSGGRLPMTVVGSDSLLPISYELPVASAQVKSAILLAGLNTAGETEVIEPVATRDHTERMLKAFGAAITIEESTKGRHIRLLGQPELRACPVEVPADPSSAAFPLVAAALLEGSEVLLPDVAMNPARTGLIVTLKEMGADIALERERDVAGEPLADLRVRGGRLRGVSVPAGRAASMIDEYPVLFVAAACAQGRSHFAGLEELRVKESDRLAVMAEGLRACGVSLTEERNSLTVEGPGKRPKGGARIATHLDHRIAMSFLVLGLAAEKPVTVDDAGPIQTSFPGFVELMGGLGAKIAQGEEA
ncbi:3-phosphoshikimate 1-carboxyvinyltransferase [Limibacillus halophilus]